VSPISKKKCHICNSTYPDKVIFCSVCGTELVDDTKKASNDIDSPLDLPSGHPNSKIYFRDEPLDTKPVDGGFITDKTQYAWKVSEEIVPFKMKSQISYSDGFKSPRLDINRFKQISFLDGFYVGSINLLNSLLLILFASLVLLTTMKLLALNWLPIFLSVVIALLYFGLSYLSFFKTAQVISDWENQPLNITKANFLSFSFIQTVHIGIISTISVVSMKIFFPNTDPISSSISIYVPSIVIILLIAFISPTFHIAKILSLLRNSGIIQNFLDAVQFPKIGLKRTLEVAIFSYIVPASLLVSIFSSASHLVSAILSPESTTTIAVWEYIIVSFVTLILAISLTYINFADVNTFLFYEQKIKQYVEPPSLNWVKKAGHFSQENDEDISNEFSDSNYGLVTKNERCSACSAILVKGAEFCTDCGKKIVR